MISNVSDFSDRSNFLQAVRNQNPEISEKIDNGSTFNIVYSRETSSSDPDGRKYHQIAARVSSDIRQVIKANGDRIFTGLTALRVTDRFYVKRCNKCQDFWHYHAECSSSQCCAFCSSSSHKSSDCSLKGSADKSAYKCTNCEKAGKNPNGHSAHWSKCPVFLEMQEKVKLSIPHYQSKN